MKPGMNAALILGALYFIYHNKAHALIVKVCLAIIASNDTKLWIPVHLAFLFKKGNKTVM